MARASEIVDEYSSQEESQEESQGMYHSSTKGGFRSRAVAVAVGLVGLVAVVAILAFHGSAHPAAPSSSAAAAPLTVRALLESDELADLTTDNLMAMGGDALASAGHEHVRGRVARALQNVSDAIRTQYPEAHHQLDNLELTSSQKEASLRVVRKFGDSRMVGLAHDIAAATHQAQQEGGDQDTMRRRLSEVLAPRAREVQQLSEEMFPGQAVSLDAAAALPQLRKWHPSVQVDLTGRRRLSEGYDSIGQGVQAHAHTLFRSLQGELGEKMPEAPVRMLSSSSSSSGDGEASFMECVMKASMSPPKLCQCIADNMSSVMKMMQDFMTGKMR